MTDDAEMNSIDLFLWAAFVLGKLGDARAVEPLIVALKDEDMNIRFTATLALGQLADTRAVEPLIAALKDNDLAYAAAVSLRAV